MSSSRRRLRLCRGHGEGCLLAAACPCRGVLPGRDALCRIPRRLLGLSPCHTARTRLFAARRAARLACNSGGRGPWCGGSCSTACWCRPACRRPPLPGSWRIRQPPCRSHQPGLSWRRLHCRTAQQLALLGSFLLVVPPPAFPRRGGVVTVRFSCTSILSGEFPPFLGACTLVGQGIQLADVLDLAH